MLFNKLSNFLRLAYDCQTPVLVLTDGHEDVFYLSIEQVHTSTKPLGLPKLNVELLPRSDS